jgi:hypothetical protein
MAINSVGLGTSSFVNQSVVNLQNQLTSLQAQLTSGKKSTTYAGLGVNEGFAIAARSQLAENAAFADTATNVNTNIGIANTDLQSLTAIGQTVQNSANSSSQTLNSTGQTIAQQTATAQLSSALGILNTQSGDRFLFSGSAVNTPSVASISDILNGTTSQAGLKQVISERQQADLGSNGLGRLVVTFPAATPTSVQVSEDVAGSPFGLKLNAVSSTLTGATVTGPTGSPPAVSVSLGNTNPNNGDQVSFKFNLPDGTTEQIQLTASSANPPPSGSFAIGTTPALTAGNLNTALTSAIKTLANTSLVAASAIQAGNDFFSPAGTATGAVANGNATALVTSATLLSGGPGTDSLAANFSAGPPPDTITVNGQTLTFEAAGTASGPNQINVNDNVGTLLAKIDGLSGSTTPSTITNGVVTLQAGAAPLTVTSSAAGFAALGFSTAAPTTALAGGTATGSVVNNKVPLPIVGTTQLSGVPGTNSLLKSFVPGNTITVNGTPITFVASGATGNQLNVTDSVQTLLSKIDSITGTSTPSTVSGGVITLHTDNAASLAITSSNPGAFAALGFSATVTTGTATGSVVNNEAAPPAPITGATLLFGAAGTDSLASSFAPGNTITVNGTPITFVASGATGNQLNVTDSVQTLLSKIDSITGTSTPSTVSGGVITLHTNNATSLTVTSSNPAAFAALGFSATATATQAPLRINGPPFDTATSLVNGTANTVAWYTGEAGTGSARATATARIDSSITVQYGIRANEQAIRSQIQTLAVFSAVTTSVTNPNADAQISALSERVAQNLSPQPGQQTIEDIQTDLATAQTTIKDAGARQTQAQPQLQSIIDQAESASPNEVASQILALQTSLQASFETTSILSQLTLTKFLPPGG